MTQPLCFKYLTYLLHFYNQQKQHHIEFCRMSQKYIKDGLRIGLNSQVSEKKDQTFKSPNKLAKITNSIIKQGRSPQHLFRKGSEYKESEESSLQKKAGKNSLPCVIGKFNSSQSLNSQPSIEIYRLREERDILQRNFLHQIQYYVRERMKDLLTIQDLLLANQYQRVQKYVETQLTILRKRHENFLGEQTCCKPTLTKDISIKSNIEDDSSYNELVGKLISNLKQYELSSTFVIPMIKKLSAETDLSTKKLAWYFEQVPFQVVSQHTRTNLAVKFISELGYSEGHKILEMIAKSVEQSTKGKYKLNMGNEGFMKSQMSKLIEQHSNSRIKKNKIAPKAEQA